MKNDSLQFSMGKRMRKEIEDRNGELFENLYIYVTDNCNMFCSHCYLGERLIERAEMPLEVVKAHLKFWKELGSDKICFLGGEPTLYPFLHEAVEFAHELQYRKVIVNTNLSKKAYNIISEYSTNEFTYIQTSLDGATEITHDRIRGKGAYTQTVKSIKDLSNQGYDVRIIMTVNKVNVDEMIPMVELAEKLGASLIKFHIMSEIGNANRGMGLGVSPKEWYEACNKLRSYASQHLERRIKISYQPAYANFQDQAYYLKNNYKGCVGKLKERLSVFPDGKCYICSFLFDFNDCFAELNDNVIEINQDSIEASFDNGYCSRCTKCQFDGCIAEELIYGNKSCDKESLIPICRLWKDEL